MVIEVVRIALFDLDTPLLGMRPSPIFKPDFNWEHTDTILTRSIPSYPHKRYAIHFKDIEIVISDEQKIEYFRRTHGVKSFISNEGDSKMILVICAIRLDVKIDGVAETISYSAPSLKPISP